MSSLRLDNYVYTKESFADAYKLLKPEGQMSVTFYYLTWWQLAHVYRALEKAPINNHLVSIHLWAMGQLYWLVQI